MVFDPSLITDPNKLFYAIYRDTEISEDLTDFPCRMYFDAFGNSRHRRLMDELTADGVKTPWTPADMTTDLWLDGADHSSFTIESDKVSAWNDKSGNGDHWVNATPSYRPSYVQGEGPVFDQAGGYCFLSGGLLSDARSVIFVSKWQDLTGDYRHFGKNPEWHGHTAADGHVIGDPWASAVVEQAASRFNTEEGIALDVFRFTDRSLWSLVFGSGAPVINSGYQPSYPARSFYGQHFEIIASREVWSLGEIKRLEGYLAHKWEITDKLDADHPFKDAPPQAVTGLPVDYEKRFAIEFGQNKVQVPVEIEFWDHELERGIWNFNCPTFAGGKNNFFAVKADSSQDPNTDFVGYKGSTPGKAVWNSGFGFVSHCDDIPVDATPSILDSTSNENHATPTNLDAADLIDGPIAGFEKALNLTDAADLITVPAAAWAIDGQSTYMLEIYYKPAAAATYVIGRVTSNVANQSLHIGHRAANQLTHAFFSNDLNATIESSTSVWKYAAFGQNLTARTIYNNGALAGSDNAGGTFVNGDDKDTLIFNANGSDYDGQVAEMRFSNVPRSGDWIALTDKMLKDTIASYADAGEFDPSLVTERWKITNVDFDNSDITTEIENLPCTIQLSGGIDEHKGFFYELGRNNVYKEYDPSDDELFLWLDASDASTITIEGGKVSQIADKSGNDNHFAQADAAKQPVINAGGLSGRDVIQFDGAQTLLSDAQVPTMPMTLFVVYRVRTTYNHAGLFCIQGTSYDYDSANAWTLDAQGNGASTGPYLEGMSSTIQLQTPGSFPAGDDNWIMSSSTLRGANDGYHRTWGGTNEISDTAINQGDLSIGGAVIGARYITKPPNSYFLIGDVAELIYIPRAVTPAHMELVEGYLAKKWGVRDRLDSAHLFKSEDPFYEYRPPGWQKKFAVVIEGRQVPVEIERWDIFQELVTMHFPYPLFKPGVDVTNRALIKCDADQGANTNAVGFIEEDERSTINAWDASFGGVYHMVISDDGTQVLDSTENLKHATIVGSPEQVDGPLGYALKLLDDRIDIPADVAIFHGAVDYTIEMFIRKIDANSYLTKRHTNATLQALHFGALNDSTIRYAYFGDTNVDGSFDSSDYEVYHLYQGSQEGTVRRIHAGGDKLHEVDGAGLLNANTADDPLQIGWAFTAYSDYYAAEVRVSKVTRSDDYHLMTHRMLKGTAATIYQDKGTPFDINAIAGQGYAIDTLDGACNFYFPLDPDPNMKVGVSDFQKTFAWNNVTLRGNGRRIFNELEKVVLKEAGFSGTFVFIDLTAGWRLGE